MVISIDLRQRRAHAVIADVEPAAWQRLSCGDGAHGQRIYDWAAVDIRPLRRPDVGHWLLARRSVSDPTDIAYYICFGPVGTDLANWCASPEAAGRSKKVSKPRRTRQGSTTIKSADTKHGIGISPSPWQRRHSSSSLETPRKKGIHTRSDIAYLQRNPQTIQPRHCTDPARNPACDALVAMAASQPSPSTCQPLPTTRPSRSVIAVLS